MPKTSLRKTMLARRRSLEPEACYSASLRIQHNLLAAPEFRESLSVGLYSSILNEVFTEEIFHAARDAGKKVLYPRVEEDSMVFVDVSELTRLQPGSFGILEPAGGEELTAGEIDLIVVPGIAFDWSGHRLGFGRGYYDRFLRRLDPKAVSVGLGFNWQMVEALPSEPHDVRLRMLITETETIRTGEISPALTGNFDP